jgi:hypothetical protein
MQACITEVSKPDFLYEHCTATVACCDFGTNISHSKNVSFKPKV